MFVFVRRLTPREPSRIEAAEHLDQRNAGQHRSERVAIGHMNLAATARLLRMFLKRRLEPGGAEVCAAEARAAEEHALEDQEQGDRDDARDRQRGDEDVELGRRLEGR